MTTAAKVATVRTLRDLPAVELERRIVGVRIGGPYLHGAPELAEYRLRSVLPTLDFLAAANARIVLLSPEAPQRTAEVLSALWARPIRLVDAASETAAREAVARLGDGEALLLGEWADDAAEKANLPEFSRVLAGICDVFCVESFDLAHEVLASTVGAPAIARCAVAGIDFERSLAVLGDLLDHPKRPLLAMLGGALSLEKLLLLEPFIASADVVLIGGELALAFQRAEGMPVGAASVPDPVAQAAGRFLARVRNSETRLHTPQDFVTSDASNAAHPYAEVLREEDAESIKPKSLPVDVGVRTARIWSEQLPGSRTILWHSPMGICEFEPFAGATLFLAEQIDQRTSPSLHRTVICGESLAAFLLSRGFPPGRVDLFSPAGAAILHYAAGHPLPAVEAVKRSASGRRGRPAVLLALGGNDQDVRMASFAGTLFSDTAAIHCIYVQPGPDEDAMPDIYQAMTKAERLAETRRIDRIFGRVNGALAELGLAPASRAFVHGDPTHRLVLRAAEIAADVMVVAGERHHQLVGKSGCHVLVLPTP